MAAAAVREHNCSIQTQIFAESAGMRCAGDGLDRGLGSVGIYLQFGRFHLWGGFGIRSVGRFSRTFCNIYRQGNGAQDTSTMKDIKLSHSPNSLLESGRWPQAAEGRDAIFGQFLPGRCHNCISLKPPFVECGTLRKAWMHMFPFFRRSR